MANPTKKIRVLLADDHGIVRMGLAALLSPERDIEVVGQAKNGIARALAAGATGAIMKNAENDELADAIRRAATGQKVISPEIRRQLATDPPVPELTPRQLDVLHSIVHGLTNHDIAQQLGICPDRVKEHVNAILTKIGAANRTEAVAIALRKHLLKI